MHASLLESPAREPLEPSRFGRYRVVRELGRGGMATVYEGRHEDLDSRVALKVLHPALAAHPRAAARFLREARAASQIRHQHVVQVYDIGTEAGRPYLVMELLEGSDLASHLAARGALPLTSVTEILLPAISALAAAHSAGVIHRDLKPANLMLAVRPPRTLHPIVLDFGISKFTDDDDASVTRSESLLGTVHYMAPELTRGARNATMATDQYAMGVMLYECATGKRPFDGQSHYDVMHAILTAEVVPPSRIRPELPPEFDALVLRAMHRDPERRFPSARALGSALLAFADRSSIALYGDDLLGTGNATPELWSEQPRTLSDGELPPASLPARTATKSGLSTRWALGLVSAYAVGATLFALKRPAEAPAPVPSQAVIKPAERATELPTPAPTPSTSSAPTLAQLPPPEPEKPAPKPARTRPSATSSVKAKASAAPIVSAEPTSPLLGSNAAPIIQ